MGAGPNSSVRARLVVLGCWTNHTCRCQRVAGKSVVLCGMPVRFLDDAQGGLPPEVTCSCYETVSAAISIAPRTGKAAKASA
jgi:hypothetical protein